jgi:hypothetical protein
MSESSGDLPRQVREFLNTQVRSGFADIDTLPADTGQIFADEAEPHAIESIARAVLHDILIEYETEQRRWPTVTDCERLDDAFLELESIGIVARQHFWCCQTCGLSAMDDEIAESAATGQQVRGYTFYHEQDTERAVAGEGLYLTFGSIDEMEQHGLQIAREIQACLERHGLSTEWDGTFHQRIFVRVDWKRRKAPDGA